MSINQKGSILPVIISIFIVILFITGTYFLFLKNYRFKTAVSPSPFPIPSPKIEGNKITALESNNDTNRVVTIEKLNLQITIPAKWVIRKINQRGDCEDYVLNDSDKLASLFLKPECGSPVLGMPGETYDPLPQDAVTVKPKNVEPETYHPWVRYYNPKEKAYTYVREITTPDEPKRFLDKGILLTDRSIGLPLTVSLVYSGPDNKKNEYLKISDRIAASLHSFF